MVLIIDVSAAQGPIDWPALAASHRAAGAILKATEGNGFIDPSFAANWKGASALKLLLGTYHFAHPDNLTARDPEAEAEHYVASVGVHWDSRTPLLWALDIEEARKIHAGVEFTSWCKRFVTRVEALTGFDCWIYTGGPFWAEHAGDISVEDAAWFARRRLWLAAYVENDSRYAALTPWREVGATLHQYSGNVGPGNAPGIRYPGIPGNVVDTSRFDGTIEELRTLLAIGCRDIDPAPLVADDTSSVPMIPAPPPVTRKSSARLCAVDAPIIDHEFSHAFSEAPPIRAGSGEDHIDLSSDPEDPEAAE